MTFIIDDAGNVHAHSVWIFLTIASHRVRFDALVRAIFAGHVAQLATDAEVLSDVRDDFVIQIQIAPILHIGHGTSPKILDGAKSVVVHICGEAIDHVLYDAEAVVHRCGAQFALTDAPSAICSAASFQ